MARNEVGTEGEAPMQVGLDGGIRSKPWPAILGHLLLPPVVVGGAGLAASMVTAYFFGGVWSWTLASAGAVLGLVSGVLWVSVERFVTPSTQ